MVYQKKQGKRFYESKNQANHLCNTVTNMYLLPESGLGIIFLINMNDYLVTNQLADIISKNVIFALLGREQYDISGSPYIVRHLLLNGAYLALVAVAVYPIATIRKWKKKKQTSVSESLPLKTGISTGIPRTA